MSMAKEYAEKINAQEGIEWPDDVLYADNVKFNVVENELVGETRWTTVVRYVYFFLGDASFMAVESEHGATEYQDIDPNGTAYEVEPKEVTVTKYVKVGEN